jgi:hypothetical protein
MSILKYTINLKTIFYADLEKLIPYNLEKDVPLTLGMILYYQVIKENLDKNYDEFILCEKIRKALSDNKQLVLTDVEITSLKELVLKTKGIIEDLKGQILQYLVEEMK